MDPTWYYPICDEVLLKVYKWYKQYSSGTEAATRPQISMNGQIVDVITKRAHKIPFRPAELEHLLRLMRATKVSTALIEDFERVQAGLKFGKLQGGYRIVELVFYRQDLEEILGGLLKAKTGKLTIEEVAAQQKEAGKDLFEV